ncbi:MAG: L-threonylcarbamoyladenylate synthase [Balneolales bacterium]
MIDKYLKILKRGDVVAFPTETVYGLGASALNPDAIKKVFQIKGRPADNPLIVHVSDLDMVYNFADDISPDTKELMDAFWPGPLTFVLPKKATVLDIITAGLDTVAIRMPDHKLALRLIRHAGPLVAPSANISGKPSPTRLDHVKNDLGVDFPVVDGGPCEIGLESTVIDMSAEPYTILRPGHITAKDLESILGKKVNITGSQEKEKPRSPGMKYSHYSPDATVRWMDQDEVPNNPYTMYLFPSSPPHIGSENANIKRYDNNFADFARDLYDRFRQADLQGFQELAIEKFENYDALLNRIQKAIG